MTKQRPPLTSENEALAGIGDVSRRIDSRAQRGLLLQRWGLGGKRVQPGSSLDQDDNDFAPELNYKNLVSSTALFPAMAATDSLAIACTNAGERRDSRNLHTVANLTLCRAALESASRTIWLLSPTDREERRKRCLAITKHELGQQKYFVGQLETENDEGKGRYTNTDYNPLLAHKKDFDERLAYLDAVSGLPGIQFRPIITAAADWIEQNVPAHDRGEIANRNLTHGMKLSYSLGSSTTHGMKWLTDYLGDQRNIMGMIADGLAASVNMTECAVALFEAQASIPRTAGRGHPYPERLRSTVSKWSRMYSA